MKRLLTRARCRALPALLLLATLLLAGCTTAFGLLYQRLDWYAAWRMDRYVSLTSEQKAQRSAAIERFWEWHRRSELPRYARELREIVAALDRPAAPEAVQAHVERGEAHWRTAVSRAMPGLCAVLRTLDDAQAGEVLARIDRDNAEFAEEYVEPPERERRRNTAKRLARSIKRWTGSINPQQAALLQAWAQERHDIAAAWLDSRNRWRAAFAQALTRRREAGSCASFEELIARPLEVREVMQQPFDQQRLDNERRWTRVIAAIVATMDPEQREHARRELLDLARQLDELARQPV